MAFAVPRLVSISEVQQRPQSSGPGRAPASLPWRPSRGGVGRRQRCGFGPSLATGPTSRAWCRSAGQGVDSLIVLMLIGQWWTPENLLKQQLQNLALPWSDKFSVVSDSCGFCCPLVTLSTVGQGPLVAGNLLQVSSATLRRGDFFLKTGNSELRTVESRRGRTVCECTKISRLYYIYIYTHTHLYILYMIYDL